MRIFGLGLLLISINAEERSLPFKCPAGCKSSAYEPICSRGKSYANLCILKQQICNGDAGLEIYKDVESCPKYEKDDDANGISVETVDKNGVIFRNFIDISGEKKSAPARKSNVRRRKQRIDRARGSKENFHDFLVMKKLVKKHNAQTCHRDICKDLEILERPVCIFGIDISSFCTLKRLIYQYYVPALAITLAKLYDKPFSREFNDEIISLMPTDRDGSGEI